MHRFVLLDRDGVINRERPLPDGHPDRFVRSPNAWRAIPRSLKALATLNASGCKVAVCAHQSAIGRGARAERAARALGAHREVYANLAAATAALTA